MYACVLVSVHVITGVCGGQRAGFPRVGVIGDYELPAMSARD